MWLLTLWACSEPPTGVNELGESWFELYNGEAEPISFEGWTVRSAGMELTLGPWTLEPGEVGLVSEDAAWSVTQPVVWGDRVEVLDADGALVQDLSPPSFEAGASYGRIPDGAANWQLLPEPSPGESNTP